MHAGHDRDVFERKRGRVLLDRGVDLGAVLLDAAHEVRCEGLRRIAEPRLGELTRQHRLEVAAARVGLEQHLHRQDARAASGTAGHLRAR